MNEIISAVCLCSLLVLAECSATKVVGGQETSIEEYPSIIHIERTPTVITAWSGWCGGNILTSRWILSAAHCFFGSTYELYYYRIRAGSSQREVGGQLVEVEYRINHPSFTYETLDGDISLLYLRSSLFFSDVVKPCSILAPNQELPDNVEVTTVGWGRLSYGGEIPEILQAVSTYTVNRETCRERYLWGGVATTVTNNMICHGIFNVGGQGPCSGDSGGPLYYRGVVIGLTSWAWGCADLWNFSVATRVSSYTEWILSVVEQIY